MLSAAHGTEHMAAAIPMPGPAGGAHGGTQGGQSHASHGGCSDGGCCAPTDSSFFVQEDFRGDLECDNCLTLELSIGTSCNVQACLWRELEMKTQIVVSKSSSVIGIATSTTQQDLLSLISACSKAPKKGGHVAPEGAVQFGMPRDANDPNYQLVDPIELMAIDAMALGYPKYYRCEKIEGKLHLKLANCVIQPVDALALLFHHWIGLAEPKSRGDASSDSKKKSKAAKAKPSLNVVVPNSFNSATRAKIVAAAQRAGANIKNIFSRGVAAVAGSLHRDKGASSALYSALLAHAEAKRNKDTAGISPLTLKGQPATKKEIKSNPFTGPMNVLFLDVDDAFAELSLVSCEGGKLIGETVTNCMGFDRVVSLAHMGLQFDDPEDLWVGGAVVEVVKDLLHRAGDIAKQSISVVLCRCMDHTLDDLLRFLEDPNYGGMSSAPGKAFGDVGMPLSPSASVAPSPKGSPMRQGAAPSAPVGLGPIVVKLAAQDLVRGGCVLAAAELSSSKLFVHEGSENSFNVSFYLSIGEDDSGGIYGVVITDPNTPEKPDKNENRVGNRERTASGHKIAIDEKPTEILAHHRRLAKLNVGPALKKSAVVNLDYTRDFKYSKSKLMYSENTADPTTLTGGARLRIYQQEIMCPHVSGTGVHTIWRLVEEVAPLTGVSSDGAPALVSKADIKVTLNPGTGCAVVAANRGDAVVDIKKSIWNIISVVGFVLFLVFLFYTYKAYGRYLEQKERQEIIDWITNFYQHNAPEKLSDPKFAEKMAEKYADKMFVFWRQLLKTYKVQWDPPSCILDEL